jgi:hypothetical protein
MARPSESDKAEAVNMLTADLTAQGSSLENTSSSVKQNGQNFSSLDNTAISVTSLSRYRMSLFTMDVTNGSPENLNYWSQSPSLCKDLNRRGYVIPVVLVTLTVLVVLVFTVFFL